MTQPPDPFLERRATRANVTVYRAGHAEMREDRLAGEEPMAIRACVREDVGRHNALDKLIGGRFLAGELPLHDRIVLVSGRASFELVQKAAIAGIPILAAVSAPSDLAAEAADRLGVTLVGFLRADGFSVYARPDRVAVGRA